ncbi:hypothetical protein CAOG_04272 [Capsaspora owczarzaki ATCC 30864]|uniref:Uncharacterized protein n=1 Tax=Capsaspora owczarzaki (strain ATCC 30864) TaxID=595528 RepID=A0A0D2WPS5_CAPO3|nr:hypothetical protein CAOG_04272 [Capsaspora owczarzaki ATCC 30864]KJE93485.1 hypothetical protein CAOG_004272 [Capsaspora owczarzaki ATCC 30864]|eukprot:XP_004348097.2 hypothetical protein CAOG_04272 [Capsaspora owczarzaki ATCC 30864]
MLAGTTILLLKPGVEEHVALLSPPGSEIPNADDNPPNIAASSAEDDGIDNPSNPNNNSNNSSNAAALREASLHVSVAMGQNEASGSDSRWYANERPSSTTVLRTARADQSDTEEATEHDATSMAASVDDRRHTAWWRLKRAFKRTISHHGDISELTQTNVAPYANQQNESESSHSNTVNESSNGRDEPAWRLHSGGATEEEGRVSSAGEPDPSAHLPQTSVAEPSDLVTIRIGQSNASNTAATARDSERHTHARNIVDYVSADEDEPFTLETFAELMESHLAAGKAFIIARVRTGENADGSAIWTHYSALHLCKIMFANERGEIVRVSCRNPLTNLPITHPVEFYKVKPKSMTRRHRLPPGLPAKPQSLRGHVTAASDTLPPPSPPPPPPLVSEMVETGQPAMATASPEDLPQSKPTPSAVPAPVPAILLPTTDSVEQQSIVRDQTATEPHPISAAARPLRPIPMNLERVRAQAQLETLRSCSQASESSATAPTSLFSPLSAVLSRLRLHSTNNGLQSSTSTSQATLPRPPPWSSASTEAAAGVPPQHDSEASEPKNKPRSRNILSRTASTNARTRATNMSVPDLPMVTQSASQLLRQEGTQLYLIHHSTSPLSPSTRVAAVLEVSHSTGSPGAPATVSLSASRSNSRRLETPADSGNATRVPSPRSASPAKFVTTATTATSAGAPNAPRSTAFDDEPHGVDRASSSPEYTGIRARLIGTDVDLLDSPRLRRTLNRTALCNEDLLSSLYAVNGREIVIPMMADTADGSSGLVPRYRLHIVTPGTTSAGVGRSRSATLWQLCQLLVIYAILCLLVIEFAVPPGSKYIAIAIAVSLPVVVQATIMVVSCIRTRHQRRVYHRQLAAERERRLAATLSETPIVETDTAPLTIPPALLPRSHATVPSTTQPDAPRSDNEAETDDDDEDLSIARNNTNRTNTQTSGNGNVPVVQGTEVFVTIPAV